MDLPKRKRIRLEGYDYSPNGAYFITICVKDRQELLWKVAPTISRIIQQFKGAVTKQVGFPLWQKLFHDHIIRSEQECQKIGESIDTNPLKWENDCFYEP